MSTLKAEVVTIDRIEKHPNADRLDCVVVKGWNVVAGRDEPSTPKYKAGDKCLYIPIDSVLPKKLEEFLFPPDGKIQLTKSRIQTIKLRGAISQGMIVDLESLESIQPGISKAAIGTDLTEKLGITKYEPPAASVPRHMRGIAPRVGNPEFTKYCDIENFKNHNRLFADGELVYVTEKLHGTSARFALLPTHADTWWKKVLKFFGLLKQYEFCFGSRNVQLQVGKNKSKHYYPTNVYEKIAVELDIENRLVPGETLYGEIVGDGIQKGYTYGCGQDEHKFFAYDVKVDGQYLNPDKFRNWCLARGITPVPFLGYHTFVEHEMRAMAKGDSTVGGQKVREGIVLKPFTETTSHIGRKVLKLINEDYELARDNSEFH